MRVAVCDDDPDIRMITRVALDAGGWEVHECADGETLLEDLQRNAADVILLDLSLPGRSGLEILGDLRSTPRTKDIPVVVLSARVDRDAAALEPLAPDEVMTKPFDPLALSETLRAVCEARRR